MLTVNVWVVSKVNSEGIGKKTGHNEALCPVFYASP
eukprot:COSAG02_NODE_732_length_17973_cov_6.920275_3_plen_36_part_00